MADFRSFCDGLLARAREAGWEVREEKPLPYGRQFRLVQHGSDPAVLSCYHGKKGFRFVPGGRAADDLAGALGAERASGTGAERGGGDDPFEAGVPRIGGDESGKGDYFGPLVTAAFLLKDGEAAKLRSLRVTDSKSLSDTSVERIAGRLEATGRGSVLRLMPREYNARYAEVGNLNVLLSEMHGRCVRRLLEQTGAEPRAVVIDQYARNTHGLERAARLPKGCRLVTRTKGESDPAVAAASILARAVFLEGLRELSNEFGHTLPPGAGRPVLKAGRPFLEAFGRERLGEVAKLHFATTDQL